ncbi:MAG: hypothetical protein AAF984_04515 [Verrucomicrobiota bacterium]
MFALLFVPLLLFSSMGIDIGLFYIFESRLVRATDTVALRISTRQGLTTDQRMQMAADLLNANFPGFGDVTWTTSGDPAFDKVGTSTGQATVYYGETLTNFTTASGQPAQPKALGYDGEDNIGSGKGGYTYPNDMRDLMYDGYEWDTISTDNNSITVKLRVVLDFNTYFLKLANIDSLTIGGANGIEVEVSKDPAVTILILDASNSMNKKDAQEGASTIRRYNALREAVRLFIGEFSDTQDYFGVVYFGPKGRIVYPKNGPFIPRENFYSTIYAMMGSDAEIQANRNLDQDYMLGPHTHGQEAMRLAYNMVENFRSRFTASSQAALDAMTISYIFFSDGDFTSARTFVKGDGYDFVHDDLTTLDKIATPWTHYIKPLSWSSDGLNGKIFERKNRTGGSRGNYDLQALVEAIDVEKIEGINANLSTYSVGTSSPYFYPPEDNFTLNTTQPDYSIPQDKYIWADWGVNTDDQKTTNITNTNVTLLKRSTLDSNHAFGNGRDDYSDNEYPLGTTFVEDDPDEGRDDHYAFDDLDNDGETIGVGGVINEHNWNLMLRYEKYMYDNSIVSFPGRLRTPRQNWTTDVDTTAMADFPVDEKDWPTEWKNLAHPYYYYRHPDMATSINSAQWTGRLNPNSKDINMSMRSLEYEPGVSVYGNHYNRYAKTPSVKSYRFGCWQNNLKDEEYIDNMENGQYIYVDSWMRVFEEQDNKQSYRTHRTFRTEEIYPKFRMGENLATMRILMQEGTNAAITDYLKPTHIFNWKKSGTIAEKWVTNNKSNIRDLGEWLIEAQCWLARENHNATVYFVMYDKSLTQEDVHFSMCNVKVDDAGASVGALYDGQNVGTVHYAQSAEGIKTAFADIAKAITLRISK